MNQLIKKTQELIEIKKQMNDFQLKELNKILNSFRFSHLIEVRKHKRMDDGYFVTWETENKVVRRILIVSNKVGAIKLIEASTPYSNGVECSLQVVGFGEGNTYGKDAYEYVKCTIVSSSFCHSLARWEYEVRYDGDVITVNEGSLS